MSKENVIVGVARLVLAIHGAESLKDKRSVLNRIKQRVKNRFNVSIAEVGALGQHETAVLAVATVSNSKPYIQAQLDKVSRLIENIGEAEIVGDDVAIEHYGGGFGDWTSLGEADELEDDDAR